MRPNAPPGPDSQGRRGGSGSVAPGPAQPVNDHTQMAPSGSSPSNSQRKPSRGMFWASAAGGGAHQRGTSVKHPKGAPVEPDKRRTRRGGRGGIRLILCPETGQRIIELLLARVLIRFHAGAAPFCFAASHRKAKNPNLCEPSASSACPVKCRQSRPCEAGFNRGASVVHHSCP